MREGNCASAREGAGHIRANGAKLRALFRRCTPVISIEGIIRPALLHDISPRKSTDAEALPIWRGAPHDCESVRHSGRARSACGATDAWWRDGVPGRRGLR